jgi:hypothetical protein
MAAKYGYNPRQMNAQPSTSTCPAFKFYLGALN